ncbi:hypothetical protein ACSBR2_018175 [Camellia fascicularis]
MKCFVCICYSALCSLVSKLLTVSHARNMKMNDDILVVVVSPDSKYIVVALLDCTTKVRKASKAEVGERKDRVTDALNVTRAAVEEGMVPVQKLLGEMQNMVKEFKNFVLQFFFIF